MDVRIQADPMLTKCLTLKTRHNQYFRINKLHRKEAEIYRRLLTN